MKSSVTIGMDSELKKEAEAFFSDLGMNFTTAVNIFVRQALRQQEIPFIIGRNPPYNAETLADMEEELRE